MLGIDGLAAGAATVGCCAQMVGFAVISYSDNGSGGLISQGLGTSMLQIGNIAKKPVIWLAPALISISIHLLMKRLGLIKAGDMKLGR